MKKISMFLTIILMSVFLNAEMVNLNPDPNGEPWYAGGWKQPTPEEQKKIDALPKLTLPEFYKNRKEKLVTEIDNTNEPYFPPIFNQVGGSCAQASGIAYNFTYEMNFMRGTSANITDNQFPSHFTYNFVNDGSGANGSTYFQGWDIAKNGGIPDVTTYGGLLWASSDPATQNLLWQDGFDIYETGMNNRVDEVISIPVGTPEGLETLKQYFNDHCDGSAAGGIVNFSAGVTGWTLATLKNNTPHAGEYVVANWNPIVNHAMTFVGYSDTIRYDYNGDRKYTNDIDLNGDSIIDMRDWEIGGLLMVNSWGTSWGTGGKAWVMYRTLALDVSEGGINGNTVYTMRTKESFYPQLKLKASISYSDRKELKITAGVSGNTSDTEPEHSISFPYFAYQGGDNIGMEGTVDLLELGLDISPLLSYVESGVPAKFFIGVEQKDAGGSGSGSIVSMGVKDNDSVEYTSTESNKAIITNDITYMSVITSVTFDAPLISTSTLPDALPSIPYSESFAVTGGLPPYSWDVIFDYTETANSNSFPTEAVDQLTMTNDDDGIAIIDLDFDFPFYGKLYDHITVCTDGSLLFGDKFVYVRNEGDIVSTQTITAYSQDLQSYPADGEGIFYFMDSDHLTIRWKSSLCGIPEVNVEFAAKIFANSDIEFFYGDNMTPGLVWSNGVSNGNSANCKISQIANTYDPSGLKTSFSTTDFPYGMALSEDGIFSGTLTGADNTWNINFRVTDGNNISAIKVIPFSLSSGVIIEPTSNFIISVSSNSILLNWDAVPSANLYHIYRSNDPYGVFTEVGTSLTNTFSDSDIILTGDKYFYYVTADNVK
ncbi:MAG: hypothetical protein JXR69_00560 [Candidatus Delongbacteria bacterium]|nr:hypothetical protein [Candidatus Delongbacteria bacterium]